MINVLIYVILTWAVSGLSATDGSGLQLSASVDLVGQADLVEKSGASNQLRARGAEIMLYSPADHLFDGMVSFAAHSEEGKIPKVELHEAVLASTKLIPRSRFRLGQFFLGVGRLNQFHQHDWPFITAPRVHEKFFADEGALDTGAEYSYLLPLPIFLELTAGITNGYIFGHDHEAGEKPLLPTHYARLVTYTDLPLDGGSQIGLNYVGRRSNENISMTLTGIDFTAKWKEAKVTQFLLQSEIWHRSQNQGPLSTFGFYVYPQYHLGNDLFLGTRFDYYSILSLKDGFGESVSNYELNVVPTLTYRSSEFAQIRLAYNYMPIHDGTTSRTNQLIELQAVFILGAHPAHDF